MSPARVLTTFEMDGLLTEKDIADRFKVMKQCRGCSNWTGQNLQSDVVVPCINCGGTDYDHTSTKSIRTYNAHADRKRKVK